MEWMFNKDLPTAPHQTVGGNSYALWNSLKKGWSLVKDLILPVKVLVVENTVVLEERERGREFRREFRDAVACLIQNRMVSITEK